MQSLHAFEIYRARVRLHLPYLPTIYSSNKNPLPSSLLGAKRYRMRLLSSQLRKSRRVKRRKERGGEPDLSSVERLEDREIGVGE